MQRIVIFEDNTQLSQVLTLLLDSVEDYKVVGNLKNLKNLETEIVSKSPDIVLMDIMFPNGNGIDGLKAIKRINKSIKVIMLTGFEDDENIFESIKAGADGYILKKTPPAKLLEYIRDATEGGAPMTPSIARQVLQAFAAEQPTSDQIALSDREKEVLKLLIKGLSYKLVGEQLFISIDTVRSHVRNIYEKLDVNSKAEAVAKALRNKIV